MPRFIPPSEQELAARKQFEATLNPEQLKTYKTLMAQDAAHEAWSKDITTGLPAPERPDWAKLLGGGLVKDEPGAGLTKKQVDLFRDGHGPEYLGWLEAHDGSGGWGRWRPPEERPFINPKLDPDLFNPAKKITVPTSPEAAPTTTAAPPTLHPQQQQAYLKSLGYEVGSLNDTTKNKDQIDAATRKFAADNKIDPNDKAAVTEALKKKAMDGAAAQIDKTQFAVGASKYSPEDVKVSQWLMKGQGRDMPKSTRPDGTVDGIPGQETKTAMPETVTKLKADAAAPKVVTPPSVSAPAVDEPQPSRVAKPQVQAPADNSEAIRKFEESLSPQQREIYTRLKEDQKNYDGQRGVNLSSGEPMGIMLFDRPYWRELMTGRNRLVTLLSNDDKGGIGLNDAQKELFKKAHPSYAEEAGRPEIKAEPRVRLEPTKFPTIDIEEIKRKLSEPRGPKDIDWRISPDLEERIRWQRTGGKIQDPTPLHEFLKNPPASTSAPPIGRKDIDPSEIRRQHREINGNMLDGGPVSGATTPSADPQRVKISGFTPDEVRNSRVAFQNSMSGDQRSAYTQVVSEAMNKSNMFSARGNVDSAGAEFVKNNLSPEQNRLFDDWKNKQGKQGGSPEYAATSPEAGTSKPAGTPDLQAQSLTPNEQLKALLARPNLESMGSLKSPSLATPGFNPDLPQPGPSVKIDAFKI